MTATTPDYFAADTYAESPLPVTQPPVSVTGNALYADVASLLDGTIPEPPKPALLTRRDGNKVFYAGQFNHIIGDPESGKTWLCLAATAEALSEGGTALVIDIDHNGVASTVARLLDLGAPEAALRTTARFRYVEPEDGAHLLRVVQDVSTWKPRVVVLDSIGELLPMFGASSNSPDDFTRVHQLVIKPLAHTGAAVLGIDHLAKNETSRAMGATGTAAKNRAVGGVSLRVTVADRFVPGKGGSAYVKVVKDRHGGLRKHCSTEDKEPMAGTFRLFGDDHDKRWMLTAPIEGERNPDEGAPAADVEALRRLDPQPATVKEARERMNWRMDRASRAMKALREPPLPVTRTQGWVTGNATCTVCHDAIDPAAGTVHPLCEAAA